MPLGSKAVLATSVKSRTSRVTRLRQQDTLLFSKRSIFYPGEAVLVQAGLAIVDHHMISNLEWPIYDELLDIVFRPTKQREAGGRRNAGVLRHKESNFGELNVNI